MTNILLIKITEFCFFSVTFLISHCSCTLKITIEIIWLLFQCFSSTFSLTFVIAFANALNQLIIVWKFNIIISSSFFINQSCSRLPHCLSWLKKKSAYEYHVYDILFWRAKNEENATILVNTSTLPKCTA